MKIGSTLNDGKVADRINDEIRRRNSDPRGIIFRTFLQLGLFLALLILTVLLVDVVQNGWGTLSTRFGDFLSGTLRSRSIEIRSPSRLSWLILDSCHYRYCRFPNWNRCSNIPRGVRTKKSVNSIY